MLMHPHIDFASLRGNPLKVSLRDACCKDSHRVMARGVACGVLMGALGLTNALAQGTGASANLERSAQNGEERAPESHSRVTLATDLYVRGNPEGVMLLTGPIYRHTYSLGSGVLLRDLYIQAGGFVGANPAYGQAAAFVEWVPIAPLQLKAQVDGFGFFGANGARLAFPSADSPYGRDEQSDLRGAEESGIGRRALLSATLRAKLGPVILRNQFDAARYRMADEPGYYLEWEYDTLVAEKDWIFFDRAAAMGVFWAGEGDEILLLGPGYEWTHAHGAGITRHRAELLFYYEPATRWAGFDRPRIFAVAGVNLKDRNREHQPFAVVGVGADFDLWSTRR